MSRPPACRIAAVAALAMFGALVPVASRAGELQLTLPNAIHAAVDLETAIYFDNIVLTQKPEAFRFEVECDLGMQHADRWVVKPNRAARGDHPLVVRVRDADGKLVETATSVLRVGGLDVEAAAALRILIVGDSLTHASVYPNELQHLFARPTAPHLVMLGTHRPDRAAKGVGHEGYGGWTWQRFASHYERNPDGTYRMRTSPFVYVGGDGKPSLDIARYFHETCDQQTPDVITFLLGINDCFSVDPDDGQAIDARIDDVFQHADTLLAAFAQAAPRAKLAVCLTPPPNSRQEAFRANYQDRYSRWGWKRIQHRLVQRQIEHFGHRQNERIYLVATELNLDPVDGYPANNGVHPNDAGYRQLAASIYAWLVSEALQGEG